MYVLPDLAFTPDGQSLALHVPEPGPERAAAPAPARARVPHCPPGQPPRTVLTERSDDWLNAPPAPVVPEGRPALPLGLGAHRLRPPLPLRARGHLPRRDPGSLDGGRPALVRERGRPRRARGAHAASSTSWPPRRTRASATSIGPVSTAPAARASRKEDGTHRVLLAPDARHFADTRSSLEAPPALVVSSTDGMRSAERCPTTARPRWEPSSGAPYEWVELKARDGAALYGRLLKPAAFDPAKQYPVVVRVYGGPGVQVVRNAWDNAAAFDQLLAEPGLPGLVPRQPRVHRPRPRLRDPGLQGHGPGRARRPARGRRPPEVPALRRCAAPRHLRLVLRRLPDPLRPDPRPRRLQGRSGGRPGHRLDPSTTRSTPSATWALPKDNPKGYEASSPLKKAADLQGGAADHPRHGRRQRAPRQHRRLRGCPDPGRTTAHAPAPPGADARLRPMENRLHRDAAILRHFETWLRP